MFDRAYEEFGFGLGCPFGWHLGCAKGVSQVRGSAKLSKEFLDEIDG